MILVLDHKSLWYDLYYSVVVNNVILMEQVNPNSGPYQGGTNITINGTDLGVVLEDIISVTLGEVPCVIDSSSYQPGVG